MYYFGVLNDDYLGNRVVFVDALSRITVVMIRVLMIDTKRLDTLCTLYLYFNHTYTKPPQ